MCVFRDTLEVLRILMNFLVPKYIFRVNSKPLFTNAKSHHHLFKDFPNCRFRLLQASLKESEYLTESEVLLEILKLVSL
jgi:hypothetical protein